jgi:hypothetical protein
MIAAAEPNDPPRADRSSQTSGADPDGLHARWCEDFKALSEDVVRIHARSQVWDKLDEAIAAQNTPSAGMLLSLLRPMYGEAQAMGVRRLIDQRRGHRSLWRLVDEMARNPTVLSRRRWVAHYQRPDDPYFVERGGREFDDLAGVGADHVPAAVLTALKDELVNAAAVVKTYVDEHIAHTSSAPTSGLTFAQLKEAVHDISRAYQRLGLVLNATHYEYEPVIQPPWEDVFSQPLFPRPDRPRTSS